MKKIIITTFVLAIGLAGTAQTEEGTIEPDTTGGAKANYNTTRTNKKGLVVGSEIKAKEKKIKSINTEKPADGLMIQQPKRKEKAIKD